MGHAEQNAALSARVAAHFAESANLKLAASQSLAEPVARANALLADCLRSGGKALACGNGGSAADAQHFAAELVNRFETERPPARAVGFDDRQLDPYVDRERLCYQQSSPSSCGRSADAGRAARHLDQRQTQATCSRRSAPRTSWGAP